MNGGFKLAVHALKLCIISKKGVLLQIKCGKMYKE